LAGVGFVVAAAVNGASFDPSANGRAAASRARPTKKKVKDPKEKVKAQPSLQPERTFFEGPPSLTETLIPGLSVFTVVGIIPFSASIARQAWTRYRITTRRIEVSSGFRGKDIVQITYKEITEMAWLRRWGGACGDLVLTLRDGARVEMRSIRDFDKNLAFIMEQVSEDVLMAGPVPYPDGPAREWRENNPDETLEPMDIELASMDSA
jgi:hypothetical protein